MTEQNGWLKILLEKIQDDIDEMKNDIKLLREERAWTKGAFWVIAFVASGIFTLGFNLLSMWLKS